MIVTEGIKRWPALSTSNLNDIHLDGLRARCRQKGRLEFIHSDVGRSIERCLRRCAMDRGDIDYVIPHNVNINTWKKLADKLSIAMERVFMNNLPRYAHCFGGDMFISLASLYEHLDDGAPPVNCLVVSAGIGASFGAAVVQIVKSGRATIC